MVQVLTLVLSVAKVEEVKVVWAPALLERQGDMIALESVTMPTSSTISKSDIEYTSSFRQVCQVISVPTSVTFTITSPSAEGGGGGSDLTLCLTS
jgi:hypothetical protein